MKYVGYSCCGYCFALDVLCMAHTVSTRQYFGPPCSSSRQCTPSISAISAETLAAQTMYSRYSPSIFGVGSMYTGSICGIFRSFCAKCQFKRRYPYTGTWCRVSNSSVTVRIEFTCEYNRLHRPPSDHVRDTSFSRESEGHARMYLYSRNETLFKSK